MKKIKRFSLLLLAAAMLLSLLAGCAGTPDLPAADTHEQSTTQPDAPDTSPPALEESNGGSSDTLDGGKTLVVYYSATDSTEAVAGYITNATGGDLFEIIPAEPYSSDDLNWRKEDSRVSREHDDPALRTIELTETAVDGWEDYDTVFIGYLRLWRWTLWCE